MKTTTRSYNSITFRLALIFIVAVLVEGLVMSVMLIAGGVITQTEHSAYSYFSSQVVNVKTILENEMKNVWTNLGEYPDEIKQQVALYRATTPVENQNSEKLLSEVAPMVVDILNSTKTTGAFLILADETTGENSHSALYIRNVDPSRTGTDKFALTMMAGPLRIARNLDISTNANWSFDLTLDANNEDFYKKPYENVGITKDEELLGYWSRPFCLLGDDDEVITYSLPISDSNDVPIGVLGVEISVDYLYKFLPTKDLGEDFFGYFIGIKASENGDISPMLSRGTKLERMLNLGKPLSLRAENESLGIYEINNNSSEKPIYACINPLGLYYNNTPFANEEWCLIGVRDKDSLLQYSNLIKRILAISLTATVIIGILVAIFVSRSFAKPIVVLADKVKRLSYDKSEKLEPTGLKEIDGLTSAIISAQKGMLELNEKLKFERDKDTLTGIRNRNAFNRNVEVYNEELKYHKNIAMGIFDLNGLKHVNDTFGHEAGDKYLKESAVAICQAFRTCDIFRIGGDEFAAIMVDVEKEAIDKWNEQLCKRMDEFQGIENFKAGVAFGYAFYDKGIDTGLEHVLMRADVNMYENKKIMKRL